MKQVAVVMQQLLSSDISDRASSTLIAEPMVTKDICLN
jgi:hypothetical protein